MPTGWPSHLVRQTPPRASQSCLANRGPHAWAHELFIKPSPAAVPPLWPRAAMTPAAAPSSVVAATIVPLCSGRLPRLHEPPSSSFPGTGGRARWPGCGERERSARNGSTPVVVGMAIASRARHRSPSERCLASPVRRHLPSPYTHMNPLSPRR